MHDFYTSIVSRALFPLHERLKGHSTVAVRRSLELTQWWSLKELGSLQLDRLRALLAHISRYVPYYRELFAACAFDPMGVQSVADLAQLPLLDKQTIRSNTDAFKSERGRGLARFNTGGSSGQPLSFFLGTERVSHDVAAKWRATRWWDVDVGDREIVVWGSPIEVGVQDHARAIRDRLLRTRLLSAFEMSEEKLDGFLTEILSFKPRMLFGYPSALSLIARHASYRGISLDKLGIRVAFVTSERLYPHQRETIERTFGCPVANGYGGRDSGFIAHQCPAGGMHITAEDIIVEIIDTDGRALPAGEAGEVVVTHLATRDFPFVRYRTGDVAVLDDVSCRCGRGLPMLRSIEGRQTDFLVAQDGTVMHGLALIYVLRAEQGVENFKVVQETRDRCRVYVEGNARLDEAALARIDEGIRRRLGSGVEILVERVERVPTEASGKHRYIVSRVPLPV